MACQESLKASVVNSGMFTAAAATAAETVGAAGAFASGAVAGLAGSAFAGAGAALVAGAAGAAPSLGNPMRRSRRSIRASEPTSEVSAAGTKTRAIISSR